MDLDLPTLAHFLSQPINAVEIALPTSLNGKWPGQSKVRTNFAAFRTDSGSLLFNYGLVSDSLLNGIFEDNPFEGCSTEGTLALLSVGDVDAERAILDFRRPMQSPEPVELIPLDRLFPDAGAIYVPGSSACEVTFTQIIRNGAFRFDVSGVRIYSPAASTLIERGDGGMLECSIQS